MTKTHEFTMTLDLNKPKVAESSFIREEISECDRKIERYKKLGINWLASQYEQMKSTLKHRLDENIGEIIEEGKISSGHLIISP
jgi:hypothetical protein